MHYTATRMTAGVGEAVEELERSVFTLLMRVSA